MAAAVLTVVCAWCRQTVTDAPKGAPVTHTICPSCLERAITLSSAGPDGDSTPLTDSPPDYFGDAFKH